MYKMTTFYLKTIKKHVIYITRGYQKIIFLISQPKHMLWVHKRTISIILTTQLMGKKIFKSLRSKIVFTYDHLIINKNTELTCSEGTKNSEICLLFASFM